MTAFSFWSKDFDLTEKIVPGDVGLLSAGSLIPADGLIIEASDFLLHQTLVKLKG